MIDEQKIKMSKLVLLIESKQKVISARIIRNYISVKNAEGITEQPDGDILNFSNVSEIANKRIDTKEIYKNENGEKLLRKQNELLDDILVLRPTGIPIGIIASVAVILFFIVWIFYTDTGSSDKTYREPIETVSNSAWNGGVYQVENYLKNTLKDPDSYEGIEWSNVIKNNDGTFVVRHKYRAKNSFGGYVVSNQMFMLDARGKVIDSY